ncbi:MAG: hypothetical protein HOC20_06595 [Chloroflexi bacterium]|jgi:hypothetical protein|nr:hypothetical protein [Chloroflexota bacterium]
MGKKIYQSGDRYAKQGSQPKKKRSQKPRPQINASGASPQATVAERSTRRVLQSSPPATRQAASAKASVYGYVFSDLKRTGIFAAIAFVILIILAIIL